MNRREMIQWLGIASGSAISFACTQAALTPLEHRQLSATVEPALQRASRCADLIIPDTDTPGAVAAGVGEFIQYAVTTWYNADEKQQFLQGMSWLDEQAQAEYGLEFLQLDAVHQENLLSVMEQQQVEAFGALKELVVVGYFTSEIGATQALHYLPMPGFYDGDHQIDGQARAWSS